MWFTSLARSRCGGPTWRLFSATPVVSGCAGEFHSIALYAPVRNEFKTSPDCAASGFKAHSSSAGSSSSSSSSSRFTSAAEEEKMSTPSSGAKVRALQLHNLPRSWMYEEIVEFLHQVAEHAGIEQPSYHPTASCNSDGNEESDSAVPHVTSPFVARLHIPFGRRTGIVYGTPTILITSDSLADYLLRDLTFDPDDYRSRIYFTETKADRWYNGVGGLSAVSEEAAVVAEQQQALSTLELDRYLLAPDLLYDMAKMRQRRLVTRRSKLLLHTFADDESDMKDTHDVEGCDASAGGNAVFGERTEEQNEEEEEDRTRKGGGKAPTLKCAGEYKDLGRGSMHSVPLPAPYVRGRRGA